MCVCVFVCVCVCVCARARARGWNLTKDVNIHFGSQAMTSLLRMGSECSPRVHKDPQLDPMRNCSRSVHIPMQFVLVINN